jgi:hypothetical protein
MSDSNIQSSGISVFSLLGLIFITLKLIGYIEWSWIWVLSPFWIPLAFFVSVMIIVFIIAIIVALFER